MKERFTKDYHFGAVLFDEEDIAEEVAIWETIIGDDLWDELECPKDKLARYFTMTNNLWFEHPDDFTEVVATLPVRLVFIYVLLYISKNYEEETIVDMEPFFEHFLKYLNDNVDMIDRLLQSDAASMVCMRVAKSFSEYIGRVIENSNNDESTGSDKES